ncbi:glucose-6-phosphate isomerase [Acaricomes phytoseiuli]|uniref:glucose-6-phosphate isomerase n=1 Tax=Acaricomes phytoseiuli TaxID=291968 RepID=UPI0022219B88|nr:glucose-6-phosphate isomerase [Acaricomes phytoseiuli]MCW1250310.1 glucose-6-phosphate isomerase [Acaricomes phytoseiuli]
MSSIFYAASGAAEAAAQHHVPGLVEDRFASRLFTQDPALWGPEAESEAAIRLGWVNAPEVSAPLVQRISALREELRQEGVDHVVLAGMGGSSLAPEVITAAAGVALTVLDSTDPEQVRSALADQLERTVLVVSSKSGSTVETDCQRRVFAEEFQKAGIEPQQRIVVVTDPGSPLDQLARDAGYREVFNADPNVGGRYSALTAFGLVPAGLAGVNIQALLDEAEEAAESLREDAADNIGLALGSALGGTQPLRNKIVIVNEGSPIPGFADWAEQLIAESTGKLGTGLLPVVADPQSPEVSDQASDVLLVRMVAADSDATPQGDEVVLASGADAPIGGVAAQMLLWEVAVAVAGKLLGINPFDQPDVEAAKAAARDLLDNRPESPEPAFVERAIEVRALPQGSDWLEPAIRASRNGSDTAVIEALRDLLGQLPEDGYLSVQAYLDRVRHASLAGIRDQLAAVAGRPVTFGWGPRFLHSTGQFHKGGPAIGVFLQITAASDTDLDIPERPFSFGELIQAQATGDAQVLADHGRPVLRLNLLDRADGIAQLESAIAELAGNV